ncbi:energy transducer TonB [Nonlabens ponticola]|uniref:TonB C-terminal domain-containing protein n=1 Tax=Nonlabens ponticola TaxID=2496866 RepID=A0A3S9N0N4_9FLAO|nr:energy transducer TonB [Nonlabens ponticola]AZQ44873.1 hypothetical protein EJ995_11770 [Nonlabens ponticola]
MKLKYSRVAFFTFVYLITFLWSNAQSFSGTIFSERNIIAKNDQVNIDSIQNSRLGSYSQYKITDGYYKSTYLDQDTIPTYSYTFFKEDFKMYDDQSNRDFITYRDARESISSPKLKIYRDSVKQILGYNCYKIVKYYDKFTVTSYVAPSLSVSFKSFKGHKLSGWYTTLKKTQGAMVLQSTTEYEDYIETSTATQVIEQQLSKRDFTLPDDKPIAHKFEQVSESPELLPITEAQKWLYLKLLEKSKAQLKSGESYKSVVSIMIDNSGDVVDMNKIELGKPALDDLAVEIMKKCKFKFKPAVKDGAPVNYFSYFPITFSSSNFSNN